MIVWRLKEARADAVAGLVTSTGDMTREEADRRRAIGSMRLTEIEVDVATKGVVLMSDVDADLTAFCHALHVAMDNACHKIADRTSSMSNAPEIREACQAELNRALQNSKASLIERWCKTS